MNVESRVYPSVTYEWPFQDYLSWKTIIFPQRAPSLRRPEQWICRAIFHSVTNKHPFASFTDFWPFKTIFWVNLHWLKALSPRRPKQWMWRVFLSVTYEHLLCLTIISTQSSVSKDTWTVNVQCHVFPGVTAECHFQDIFWENLYNHLKGLCLPGDLENEHVEQFSQVSLTNSFSNAIFQEKVSDYLEEFEEFCVTLDLTNE